MKTITSFDDALHYVNHLGFAGSPSDSIACRQGSLCATADQLLRASGQTTWYHAEFKPFQVRFHLYRHEASGYTYPALSTFTVKRGGLLRTLDCNTGKVTAKESGKMAQHRREVSCSVDDPCFACTHHDTPEEDFLP